MKCVKCKKSKKLINLASLQAVCKECFSKVIEKRVRKRIRLNKLFKKGDVIVVQDKLSLYLIKKIIKGLPVKLSLGKPKPGAKLAIKQTLDDALEIFLENLLFGKNKKEPKGISVLRGMTDKEAMLFAKINKIKFTPNKKKTAIAAMLDRLEKKYPEIRFSLFRSISELK